MCDSRFLRTVFVLFPLLAFGQTAEERARIERLENSVLAPCCYAETVAHHQSEVALRMKVEIAKFVAAGKSDREILDGYASLYGSKVLVDPRTQPHDWVPFVPWLTLVVGVFGTAALVRRWRKRSTPAAVPASGVAEIDDLDLL
jgi:cytochrome c-type biogenesis protein CcmH